MSCGCKEKLTVPAEIRKEAKMLANESQINVAIIFCKDWDIVPLGKEGERKIQEIITYDEV